MPIPEVVRPIVFDHTRIEYRIERPGKPNNREEHEVTMNRRHYKIVMPRDWKMYDNSYQPKSTTGELPGKIERQFVAPAKDGTVIIVSYRGRSASEDSAAVFHKLM